MNKQELKKEIKTLNKLKNQMRPSSDERLGLVHKIKDLKKQLNELNIPEPEKDIIITEILKLDKTMRSIDIDLRKHSIGDLQKYLNKLKKC